MDLDVLHQDFLRLRDLVEKGPAGDSIVLKRIEVVAAEVERISGSLAQLTAQVENLTANITRNLLRTGEPKEDPGAPEPKADQRDQSADADTAQNLDE